MYVISIRKYTHFFTVKDLTPDLIGLVLKFSLRYVHREFRQVGNKTVTQATKVYGSRAANNEFRFHIGQYDDFIKFLKNKGVYDGQMHITEEDLYSPIPITAKVKDKFEEREYQTNIKEFLCSSEIGDNHSRLVALQTGLGKSILNNTLVKVPRGWKKIGELKIGDEIIAADGTTTHVTGVYPQGIRPTYKMTFSDGRDIICDKDHLWKVYSERWATTYPEKWIVMTTEDVIKTNAYTAGRTYIPLCESERSADIELPMDPYILGYLIGNGYLTKGLKVSTKDDFIVNYFKENLPKNLCIRFSQRYDYYIRRINKCEHNTYIDILKDLKLLNKRSWQKFIPSLYLRGSTRQRMELLQGLMDSDGYISDHGNMSHCSVSKTLAKDVQYLARSLGAIAKITTKKTFYTYKEKRLEGRLAYNVHIRHKYPEQLFKLPRKLERANNDGQYCNNLKLRIDKIEPAGNAECVCISIDHPDKLYVCKDFVVTHNTFISLAASSQLGYRTMILILPKYIEKWAGDVVNVLDVLPEDVLTIRGGKDLRLLLHLSEDDSITAKYIIISLTTLQNYYNDYVKYGTDIVDYGYPYPPEEMCRKLGIGTVILDEAHQQLYSVYRALVHIHVPKVIALSATMISDDQFITNMQSLMFPKEIRYDKVPIKRYTKVVAYAYGFKNPSMAAKIRISNRGSTNYSHLQFENSIMKNKQLLQNYLSLICYIIDIEYKQKYITGDKYLVYAASIEMCTRIVEALKAKYPNYDIRRYVEDDPYENVIDSDIRVSTVLSAGTAVDIPNLRGVLLTTSIQSPVSNLQSMGRLRELKDRDVTFSYLFNYHIPKQVNYHRAKKELLYNRVVSIKEFKVPEGI